MVGRLLDGRYRIGARIARGGMASVYEATDIRLDRVVAVKVMHPGLGDDDEFAARFVREARAAARLSHPNVVGGLRPGRRRRHRLPRDGVRPRPHPARRDPQGVRRCRRPRRSRCIEPVLSALAAAHRAGLIHRDIKPENVLIADDGRVKVADFGLAKAVSADTQHTATGGVLIGTVSYLAPELVVDGRADARADVYAAGVVLYELLTGRKPHEGESPIQVAYKHVHEDVPAAVERWRPSSRRTSTRWSPAPPPATASQRPADAGGAAPPGAPGQPGARRGRRRRPRADRRPAAARCAPSWSRPEPRRHRADPFDTGARPLAAADSAVRRSRRTRDGAPTALDRTPHRDTTARWRRRRSPPAPPAAGRADPSEHDRPRRSRKGPVLLLLALLLAAGAGAGAWWFGWARYTSTPGVLGLTPRPPSRGARGRRPGRRGGRPGVLRDRRRGPCRHRPRARRRGCSTAAP